MTGNMYLCIAFTLTVFTIVATVMSSYKKIKSDLLSTISSDITVEQMRQSEKRVSDFLRTNGLTPGTEIGVIAQKLKIIDGGNDDSLTAHAVLGLPNENGERVACFKSDLSPEERMFALAHECGHRIDHDEGPRTRPSGQNKPGQEQLADYVGAALLMPIDSVYSYLCENNYRTATRRRRHAMLKVLCRKYEVDREVALRRVHEVYAVKEGD